MAFKNIHLIVNPAAGQPKPILHVANSVFNEHDVQWHIAITRPDCTGEQLTREALDAGADLVVACGGDGTVKDVINGLLGSDVPLAIMHGGTGNAMAHEFSIPVDHEESLKLIFDKHVLQTVDVGKASAANTDDDYFILRASIGLQSKVLKDATRESKTQLGNLAYVLAGLRALAGSALSTFNLTLDGDTISGEGLTCMITNSASVGGQNSFSFAPEVDPSDGVLDAFVLDASFESIISALSSALELNSDAYKHHWTGRTITVETPEPQEVTLDGEPFGQTPVEFTILPDAIRVLVPPDRAR